MYCDNSYNVLGLSESATQEEVCAKYKSLAREHHPDRNPNDPGSKGRMQKVNAAYEQLRSPEGRAAVNKRLAEQRERQRREAEQRERQRQATAAGIAKPPASTPSVQPQPGWGAVLFGVAAVVSLAHTADRSRPRSARGPAVTRPSKRAQWDPNAGRFRGSDGRFASG
jgi:curved DNA-binding protein CbpA